MRPRRLALVVVLISLFAAGPARAVTDGQPDGSAHPYVVLVAFYDSDGAFIQRCSGTLLSAEVVLTAGHCTAGATFAKVWNSPVVIPSVGWTLGVPVTYPGFDPAAFPESNDIGVVLLVDPISLTEYGALPSLGYLDAFAERRGPGAPFTLVGYGVQSLKPRFEAAPVRYAAPAAIVSLRSALTAGTTVQLSGHPSGACFGDSGAPVLDDNVVVAVAFGTMPNQNCKGPFFAIRIDREPLSSWIAAFLS